MHHLTPAHAAGSVFSGDVLNDFMARPRAEWQALRARLTALLGLGGLAEKKAKLAAYELDSALRDSPVLQARCLVPLSEVRMHMPAAVGDYTDFYSSREHASNARRDSFQPPSSQQKGQGRRVGGGR